MMLFFFLLFTVVETYAALFISSVANGIVYVAALSYVNIRSEKQERPIRIGICHFWKIVGVAIVITLKIYFIEDPQKLTNTSIQTFYEIIGYIMIGTSGMFIILMLLNEFRQRQGIIYNYRDCLDHENSIANNYCKLFSKNEVIIERNPTVSSASLWKSTENLLPRNKKNYTNLWTIYMLLPKLHGAIMWHYFLITITFAASVGLLNNIYASSITIWIMVLGSLIGCMLFRFIHISKIYTVMSTVAIIALGVSYIFYTRHDSVIAICLWVHFFAMSVSTAIPDIALMEISKIRFSEGALAVGYFFEIVPIAILQATQRDAYQNTQFYWYTDKYYLPVVIATIVILVVTSLLYQLHMPNTFIKSLLQIQNELLKYSKYFAFDFDQDTSSVAATRRSADSNSYVVNNVVNVFDDHEKSMAQSSRATSQNDYSEIIHQVPEPKAFNYNTDLPKPPSIIPRINISKSMQNPMYSNVKK